MDDRITLDRINTHSEFNLTELYKNDNNEDDIDDSPYSIIKNTCNYFEPTDLRNLLSEIDNSLSMFCLNCQGLRAHWDAFCDLINNMNGSNLSSSFDVIGVTELYGMSPGEFSLNGYYPIEFKTRNDTMGSRGGVGMYIKNNYQFTQRKDLSIFIPHILESIFIEININNKSVIIGTIYRPNTPPKADIDIFMHTMADLLNQLNKEPKDVFIMGDINIDLLKYIDHPKTNDYLEDIFSQGFIPLITKPSRITNHSATLIDHIYTNKRETHSSSGIVITDLSDHFGIFSITNLSHKKKLIHKAVSSYRAYTSENVQTFNNLLSAADFTTTLDEHCPNAAYKQFMTLYLNAHDIAFPLKTGNIPRKYVKHCPWITKGLVQSSITKSKLLHVKLKTPSNANIIKYKMFMKIYNRLLRIAKRTYFEDQLQLAKHDMKQTWKILKTAMNSSNKNSSLPDYFLIDNNKISDKTEICNKFNAFFATVGSNISNSVPNTPIPYTNFLPNPHYQSMFFDPIFPHDIINIVSKLKSKTSQGHDNLSSKLVKQSIHQIAIPMAHIINQSMVTGTVPLDMKIARIIPIFKSGNQNIFNNYRPISILPAFSKLLEKVISIKLIKYLESQKLIYKHQYGFRPKHNTMHPIIHLLNQIASENDKPTKNLTLSVFIDLSKAFDTINYDILLNKLQNLGVRGIPNLWFRNYLSDRKQYLDIYNLKSTTEQLNCGVPQGSILGPLLFLVYVNDIHNGTNLNVLSFADDTTVSASSDNIPLLYQTMNSELEKLNTWFMSNRLCLNVKKTKYILFRPNNVPTMHYNEDIILNGEVVEQISHAQNEKSFKFLGIHIDETLSWKHHINKVCKKISSSNYIINKVKHFLPKSILHNLYATLVQSHINYGILIWGSGKSINKVFKLQKKSIRIINAKPYNYHTEPLFKKSEILKVPDQYQYNILIFMHQLKYHNLPESFNTLDYFVPKDQPITRQNDLANCSRFRTTHTSILPLHHFPRTWNKLEPRLRNIMRISSFKKSIFSIFLKSYNTSIHCENFRCKQCYPV